MILENCEPKVVFRHFESLSQVPRGSGNEKAVSDYIANWARGRGLRVVQDEFHNLVIFKPGKDDTALPLILQAHLDMVCEKNEGTEHDFEKDPIKLYVDGDFVKARGTTLGADNGIGVAICMALLESDCMHPPLEIVLTTDEETGMTGAENLDTSILSGKRMLNLDASDEKTFTMGCATGTTAEFTIPLQWEDADFTDFAAYKITISGLKGGHSGGDIDKNRGNAIRILAQVLGAMGDEIRLSHISGGMKINAIPREAEAVIAVPQHVSVADVVEKCRGSLSKEYHDSAGLKIEHQPVRISDRLSCMSQECSAKIIACLLRLPNGVLEESQEISGLVNASCNIGVAETTDEFVKISAMPRSATEGHTREIEAKISALAREMGAQVKYIQRSPAWSYNPNSALLNIAMGVYRQTFGTDATPTAVHGGLECGVFLAKMPGMDIISYGPDSHDFHTPDERLSISSTARVWKFLQALVKVLCLVFVFAACAAATPGVFETPEQPLYEPQEQYMPQVQDEVHVPDYAQTLPYEQPEAAQEPIPNPIETLLSQLTTEEKIGMLFMLRLPWRTQYADHAVQALMNEIPVGGFILFGENIDTREQVQALTAGLNALSRHDMPLLIAIDEEGGRVSRAGRLFPGGVTPSAYEIGQADNPESAAFVYGRHIGNELRNLGINMNFAPVGDIWSNPQNAVIGTRAFGRTAEAVSPLVAAMVRGLMLGQEGAAEMVDRGHYGGVMAVIKHFPGHGDTYEDSHFQLAFHNHDLARFNEKEALPFISGIADGAKGVMVGHISTPQIGGHSELVYWMQPWLESGYLPATFSDFWLQEVLRGQMGFDGLIITDALDMRALTDHFSCGQIAVGAFLAGADILLIPASPREAFSAMLVAHAEGVFDDERLKQSVRRILSAKIS